MEEDDDDVLYPPEDDGSHFTRWPREGATAAKDQALAHALDLLKSNEDGFFMVVFDFKDGNHHYQAYYESDRIMDVGVELMSAGMLHIQEVYESILGKAKEITDLDDEEEEES